MATFNREHFKRIAAMLQATKPREVGGWNGEKLFASGKRKQWEETVDYMSHEFEQQEPKFKPHKFKAACDR